VEWDELKVHDTVICTSYISSGKLFFKPALPEKPAGTKGGSESEIAGSLVRDFWTVIEYGGVPEFLGRLRNRGHCSIRLIARWGEEILLETSGNQKTWSTISGWDVAFVICTDIHIYIYIHIHMHLYTHTCTERDCFYYIIIQTYEVGLHSRRHPIEMDAGTRPFASLDAPIS